MVVVGVKLGVALRRLYRRVPSSSHRAAVRTGSGRRRGCCLGALQPAMWPQPTWSTAAPLHGPKEPQFPTRHARAFIQ